MKLLACLFLLVALCSAQHFPFSQSNGNAALLLSAAAYCDPLAIANWTCYPCTQFTNRTGTAVEFESYAFHTATNNAAFVGYAPHLHSALVVFRGTVFSSVRNWIENLYYSHFSPYPLLSGAAVHGGFYYAWQGLQDNVTTALSTVIARRFGTNETPRVLILGHSLGGALANLAAAQWHFEPPLNRSLNVSVMTFGQPRVGNNVFAAFTSSALALNRVVHYEDIVPHLPPQLLGFVASAREVWYSTEQMANASQVIICDAGEDPRCSDSLPFWRFSINDHELYYDFEVADTCTPPTAHPKIPLWPRPRPHYSSGRAGAGASRITHVTTRRPAR